MSKPKLTGEVRVRVTRWQRKCILQVQKAYELWEEDPDDPKQEIYSLYRHHWVDATIEDVQALGGVQRRRRFTDDGPA